MKIKKIFFDMDGVLADFDSGVETFCGIMNHSQAESTKEEENTLWDAIRKVEHFYYKLDVLPGACDMFKEIYDTYGDHCEILTGIPKPERGMPDAAEDKVRWVRKYLSDTMKVNTVRKKEKKNYCTGEDCVLIDDLEENIIAWKKSGGTGILFESPEQVLVEIKRIEAL